MFYVDEEGTIIYNNDITSDSLFGTDVVLEENPSDVLEDMQQLPETLPDADILDTVSGSDAASLSPNTLNYSVTVYAAPASSPGYPNSQSLSYLEDIVQGYPLHYKYIAYRTSEDYAQSMILFVAPEAELSGDSVYLQDVDIIELVYERGSSGSYDTRFYRTFRESSAETVRLPSSAIVYTNVLDGYGQFDVVKEASLSSGLLTTMFLGVIAVFALFRLLGGIRHD